MEKLKIRFPSTTENMFKKILKNLVPILLCLIALSQIYMVFTKNLTPWKGGGFGMFAMIDRMENRPVHITLSSFGEEFIVNPKDLLRGDDYYRVKSRPDTEILDRLATKILNRKWVYNQDVNQLTEYTDVQPYNDSDTNDIIVADSVIIQVYRLKMNIQDDEITLKSIKHLQKPNNLSELEK